MIRVFGLISLCVVLWAGCGDSPQPVRREIAAAPADADPHGSMPSNPHGSMPSSPHGSMPISPHGTMGGAAQAQLDSPIVRLGAMALTAPESWQRLRPESGFTLAEFKLPRAEGDDADGRLTITSVGGSVEANLERWRGQFGGKPDQESREQIEIAGIQFATISLLGTFNAQHGGTGQTGQVPSYQMLAAIFDIQGHQHIVKCYGPKQTMAKHAEAYDAFLKSLDWAKAASPPASAHPPTSGHPPTSAHPAKPDQTAKPEESKKPEETKKPKESKKPEPEESKKPEQPVESKEPAKPAEKDKPEKSAEPERPAKPEEAKQAEKPAETKESAKPAESEESEKPAKPEQ